MQRLRAFTLYNRRLCQRVRGVTVHKAGSKIGTNMTACISSLQTLTNTCRKVPLQVNFFQMTTFCFDVYKVNQSISNINVEQIRACFEMRLREQALNYADVCLCFGTQLLERKSFFSNTHNYAARWEEGGGKGGTPSKYFAEDLWNPSLNYFVDKNLSNIKIAFVGIFHFFVHCKPERLILAILPFCVFQIEKIWQFSSKSNMGNKNNIQQFFKA